MIKVDGVQDAFIDESVVIHVEAGKKLDEDKIRAILKEKKVKVSSFAEAPSKSWRPAKKAR